MTETRATQTSFPPAVFPPAVFPPGRYGRRRDGRRRILGPALLAVVIAAASIALAVKLYRQYGDPTYDAQVLRYTGVTDTRITVDFIVRVPAGGSATCLLRARSYDGTEVGRRTVTVTAPADASQVSASETLPTTARAIIAEALRCHAPTD